MVFLRRKEVFMPLPFRLDYVIEKTLREAPASEQRVLRKLAGLKLSQTEARALWTRVLEHKWLLSERLGRNVGLHVAVIDYFENIDTLPTGKATDTSSSGLMRRFRRSAIIHRIV